MKAIVNGVEIELNIGGAEIVSMNDLMVVRTSEGASSAAAIRVGDTVLVSYKGRQYRIESGRSKTRTSNSEADGKLSAPMPGQIVDVRVCLGDKVKKGDTVLVLEAMKTQQPFAAPFDGQVTELPVKKGDQVDEGTILAFIEKLEGADV